MDARNFITIFKLLEIIEANVSIMDQYACHMANLLAGNKVSAALIEMVKEGLILKFDKSQLVSVCGADMQGMVNDNPIENWSSFVVPDGGTLSFGGAVSGQCAYIAVHEAEGCN